MSSVDHQQEETQEPVYPLGERLTYALRQSAIMAAVLFVLGRLTNASRPLEAGSRDIVTAPFMWAIVAWIVLLFLHAIAFERSEMRRLEAMPLLGAVGVAMIAFVIGASLYDAGSTGERLVFLVLNSVGVALFWWAVISIGALLWIRVGGNDQSISPG
jgi:hypothetical protein